MSNFEKFKNFILSCPTADFAASVIEKNLLDKGFSPLQNAKNIKGEKLYFKKNGLIAAFIFPSTLEKATFILSHLDSPCFKLKPHPLVVMNDSVYLRLETYGSPLFSSYLGKPLKIAGSYVTESKNGLKTHQIDLKDKLVFIPDPAIHLSKESNASLEKSQLFALISNDKSLTLEKLINSDEKVLSHNLFLVSSEAPKLFAENLIASPRLDNLSSSFAVCEAISHANAHPDTLLGAIFFDHEEIGSQSLTGAQSQLLKDYLQEILHKTYGKSLAFIEKKAFSLDVAHANHPSFSDKFDPGHPILLNHGLVIKHHAQQKYAQDLMLYAQIKQSKLPIQEFTMRNEVGTGSTLGPYFTSIFATPTQDVGIGLLGMHSTCEIIGLKDLETLSSFVRGALNG